MTYSFRGMGFRGPGSSVFEVREACPRFRQRGWPRVDFSQDSIRRQNPAGKRQQAACVKAGASLTHSKAPTGTKEFTFPPARPPLDQKRAPILDPSECMDGP